MKRLKVLISAYACEPGKGSEPGVGWNVAREMAKHHDVWVLTRANNRLNIEAEMARNPVPNLNFSYYDLPAWASWWKDGGRGVQLYYYLWQAGAYFVARRLHHDVAFDVVHHVTFVKYWAPSFVSFLDVPFLWGPVGGGESAPKAFLSGFSPQGRRYERLRMWARLLGECDPFVRLTARRSRIALAATEDTAERLKYLSAGDVHVLSQVGLGSEDLAQLDMSPNPLTSEFLFVSIGNLLHWKGFHLGLCAFAEAQVDRAAYWVIGDGPERANLEALAHSLGVANQVTFIEKLPRAELLRKLARSHALVHPSLHDSGGFVCLEAMAAGKPVICLELGGPAVQVTPESGFVIAAGNPEQAVRDIARAMQRLAREQELRQRMGEAGRQRVCEIFSWERKGRTLDTFYRKAVAMKEVKLKQ